LPVARTTADDESRSSAAECSVISDPPGKIGLKSWHRKRLGELVGRRRARCRSAPTRHRKPQAVTGSASTELPGRPRAYTHRSKDAMVRSSSAIGMELVPGRPPAERGAIPRSSASTDEWAARREADDRLVEGQGELAACQGRPRRGEPCSIAVRRCMKSSYGNRRSYRWVLPVPRRLAIRRGDIRNYAAAFFGVGRRSSDAACPGASSGTPCGRRSRNGRTRPRSNLFDPRRRTSASAPIRARRNSSPPVNGRHVARAGGWRAAVRRRRQNLSPGDVARADRDAGRSHRGRSATDRSIRLIANTARR